MLYWRLVYISPYPSNLFMHRSIPAVPSPTPTTPWFFSSKILCIVIFRQEFETACVLNLQNLGAAGIDWCIIYIFGRVVTKISRCWVNTTSRWGIKQLGICFNSIFFYFPLKVARGNPQPPPLNDSPAVWFPATGEKMPHFVVFFKADTRKVNSSNIPFYKWF